jgi:hypothetical protein
VRCLGDLNDDGAAYSLTSSRCLSCCPGRSFTSNYLSHVLHGCGAIWRSWRLPGPGSGEQRKGLSPARFPIPNPVPDLTPADSLLHGSPKCHGCAITHSPTCQSLLLSHPPTIILWGRWSGSPLQPVDLARRQPQLQRQLRLPVHPNQPQPQASCDPEKSQAPVATLACG